MKQLKDLILHEHILTPHTVQFTGGQWDYNGVPAWMDPFAEAGPKPRNLNLAPSVQIPLSQSDHHNWHPLIIVLAVSADRSKIKWIW